MLVGHYFFKKSKSYIERSEKKIEEWEQRMKSSHRLMLVKEIKEKMGIKSYAFV